MPTAQWWAGPWLFQLFTAKAKLGSRMFPEQVIEMEKGCDGKFDLELGKTKVNFLFEIKTELRNDKKVRLPLKGTDAYPLLICQYTPKPVKEKLKAELSRNLSTFIPSGNWALNAFFKTLSNCSSLIGCPVRGSTGLRIDITNSANCTKSAALPVKFSGSGLTASPINCTPASSLSRKSRNR